MLDYLHKEKNVSEAELRANHLWCESLWVSVGKIFYVGILHFEYSVLSTSSDCNVDLCPAVCVLIFPSLSKDIERQRLAVRRLKIRVRE